MSLATRWNFVRYSNYFIYLADALKAGQKTAENAKETAGKKLDEAKKAGEELRKKASGSVEDL